MAILSAATGLSTEHFGRGTNIKISEFVGKTLGSCFEIKYDLAKRKWPFCRWQLAAAKARPALLDLLSMVHH